DLFTDLPGTLAILCKNSVVKNLVEILPRKQYRVSNIRQLAIDAQREFDAAVDASLLVMTLSSVNSSFTCQVGSLKNPETVDYRYGWKKDSFVSNLDDYQEVSKLDGKSPFEWRQGVKHDCSKVMELNVSKNLLTNGVNEIVEVEAEYVYWLLKSSDLKDFEVTQPRKKVIITQTILGEDTSQLEHKAPKLWQYLIAHREEFEKRKSRIYRDKPPFSIFGIGEYVFAPYKVAISGLYKKPNFTFISPIGGYPVILDDTCYYLGFEKHAEAFVVTTVLNCQPVQRLLGAIAFRDAKRPYTKQILMRIDLIRVLSETTFSQIRKYWDEIEYHPRENITKSQFQHIVQTMIANYSKQTSPQHQLLL
ncbi:SAM-dependent methyltransferase, partial [bacterium]|nr:SAM-dependent methyltransferase [bacterium]